MASLTEIAYYTKKIIKFGLIGFLILLIIRTGYRVGKQVWEQINPPPPPPPTVEFGQLPAINFPQEEEIAELEFQLETATGQLPSLPSQAKVYQLIPPQPTFSALDQAKEKAFNLGFRGEPTAVSEKTYRWQKSAPFNYLLEMNILSGNFSFSYDWQTEETVLAGRSLPNRDQAIEETKKFLKKIESLEEDLEQGLFVVSYLQARGARMVSAVSLSEADFVRVDVFRKPIEEIPVLTADPQKGIITLVFTGLQNTDGRILQADFNYSLINYQSASTYPLKSSSQAWQELKTGQAFIANYENNSEEITIRKIYLAYFESLDDQNFLQPIFVFEGDENFIAELPAVADGWFAKN